MSSRLASAAILALALAGCGGGGATTGKRAVGPAAPRKPALPKVKAEALREFDAGMRALRLGGPEAGERAIPRLRAAVELDGTLWEAWHNLGVIFYAVGDDEAAADAFGKALAVNPASRRSLLARAETHRRAGVAAKARADYDKALAADPEDGAARARLASLLRESGQLDEALDAVREALRREADARIYVELGLIYLAQGRDELAELVLNKAIVLDKKLPAAYNGLALVSLARGRDQEAFERFDHASSLDPAFRDARFNTAAVLLDAGDYQRAVTELEAVIAQDGGDLGAQVALGVAYRGLAQHDRARATWERVVKAAPRRSVARADALYNLAVLQLDFTRDEPAARTALDRYLQEAPASHPKRKEAEARRKELGS